ncbi:trk system potassium uptake protein TrkH [Desulfitispora alkaliphila]|uniref:TrkH family potassium uptake protein n=1 Tax=Desulfitispora alkaliphila TaxID=622674 RepID=UPI003D1D675E
MNYKLMLNLIGKLQVVIGVSMLFPLIWALYRGEEQVWSFAISAGITFTLGVLLILLFKQRGEIHYKEGFVLVAAIWIVAALSCSLPFYFAGTFETYADAFFESMSGVTTTGASVMTDIEGNPESILLWRATTHWLGGMGIVVLFVGLLAQLGIGAMKMFKAEVPGPTKEKIRPRLKETARVMLSIYIGLTGIQLIIMFMLGLNFLDAVCQSFSTIATGGFSNRNESVGAFDPIVQWAITLFMFLGGTSFVLYYRALKGKSLNTFWKNEEFRLYGGIIATVSLLTFLNVRDQYASIEEALRHATFQVVSITTTTGFATADYDAWPIMVKVMIMGLMFMGGCVGSTSGGLKMGRHLIMLKHTMLELRRTIHPRAIISLKINKRVINPEIILSVLQFFFLYMVIFLIASIYMASLGFDLTTSFTSAAASIGNVGPGFGLVGPAENFAFMPSGAKYVHSLLMLLGRLELYTILVLLSPKVWKS